MKGRQAGEGTMQGPEHGSGRPALLQKNRQRLMLYFKVFQLPPGTLFSVPRASSSWLPAHPPTCRPFLPDAVGCLHPKGLPAQLADVELPPALPHVSGACIACTGRRRA